jgi:uncharacterized transporter YbjL
MLTQPPRQPLTLAAAIVILWLGACFVSLRIVIPALINKQNDGALLAALMLGAITATSPLFAWSAIRAIFEERKDED